MDRCTIRCIITEILLKTALNTIQQQQEWNLLLIFLMITCSFDGGLMIT